MAQIDNIRLPPDIEAGAEIGPSFQTSIIELTSGREQRNQDWSRERLKATISYGMMRDRNDQDNPGGDPDRTFMELLSFYRARRGMLRGFLFKNWSDYQADNVVIGEGDGTNRVFPLKMIYDDSGGSYERRITRPIASTVEVRVEGVVVTHTLADGGIVTITAVDPPGIGDEVTASFEFDIPVRFNTDVMQVDMAWAKAGQITDIELIEIRDE